MAKSPKITKIEWGKTRIDGHVVGKDFILYPGGAVEWDWNEFGTNHQAGIQAGEIKYLLKKECDVIVLSKGFYGRLNISGDAIDVLKKRNIEFYILKTENAVKKYNELAKTKAVGALIHSTC